MLDFPPGAPDRRRGRQRRPVRRPPAPGPGAGFVVLVSFLLAYLAIRTSAGFTLDEFALWVHLQDVYWSEEGRASFDAVACTAAFAGLVVIGTRPFGLDEPTSPSAASASSGR